MDNNQELEKFKNAVFSTATLLQNTISDALVVN